MDIGPNCTRLPLTYLKKKWFSKSNLQLNRTACWFCESNPPSVPRATYLGVKAFLGANAEPIAAISEKELDANNNPWGTLSTPQLGSYRLKDPTGSVEISRLPCLMLAPVPRSCSPSYSFLVPQLPPAYVPSSSSRS